MLDRVFDEQSALRRQKPNEVMALLATGAILALIALGVLAVNLRPTSIWLFGLPLSLPLALQWVLAFSAGVVTALRIKKRDNQRHQR